VRVTFLGTGTQRPTRRRAHQSGLLVETADERLLVDCGAGTLAQLARAGLGADAVDRIALTHFHPDHTLDLVAILFAHQHPAVARRAPLRIYGPPGLEVFYERLQVAWLAAFHRTPGNFRLHEIPGGPHDAGPWRITAAPTPHDAASQAYRVEAGGIALGVTGDTGPSPALAQLFRNVDLLVSECALATGVEARGHLNARQAGELARAANAQRLVLTHLTPEVEREDDPTLGARATFPGPVALAEDGMAIEVGA